MSLRPWHSTAPLLVGGVVACSLPFAACVAPTTSNYVEIEGETMGTTYSVKVISHDGEPTEPLTRSHVEELLEQINDQMSTYREDSELSRFNQSDSTEAFSVSEETATVVAHAIEISNATGGAFDVTAGALVNLWSFGPESVPKQVPTDEAIATARERVGTDMLWADPREETLAKENVDLYVDLSGIAKGFGVDELARLAESLGYEGYLIDIGGEMRARGVKINREPWRVAIERPVAGERSIQRTLELTGGAIATSGDYRNYFEQDGVRYSHMIDPRTGRPITHRLASVSVLADECMTADAWATGLMVLGEDEGYTLAEETGLAALFLVRSDEGFEEKATSAFSARFGSKGE